jgi:hypothetical protein
VFDLERSPSHLEDQLNRIEAMLSRVTQNGMSQDTLEHSRTRSSEYGHGTHIAYPPIARTAAVDHSRYSTATAVDVNGSPHPAV